MQQWAPERQQQARAGSCRQQLQLRAHAYSTCQQAAGIGPVLTSPGPASPPPTRLRSEGGTQPPALPAAGRLPPGPSCRRWRGKTARHLIFAQAATGISALAAQAAATTPRPARLRPPTAEPLRSASAPPHLIRRALGRGDEALGGQQLALHALLVQHVAQAAHNRALVAALHRRRKVGGTLGGLLLLQQGPKEQREGRGGGTLGQAALLAGLRSYPGGARSGPTTPSVALYAAQPGLQHHLHLPQSHRGAAAPRVRTCVCFWRWMRSICTSSGVWLVTLSVARSLAASPNLRQLARRSWATCGQRSKRRAGGAGRGLS